MSEAERLLAFQLKAIHAPAPEIEYPFAAHHVGMGPGIRKRLSEAGLRNWRFDFAWPTHMLAVEIEGGGGIGRHTTAKGFRQDMLKYHHAMVLGWSIYRCDAALVRSGMACDLIHRLLQCNNEES